VLPGFERGAGGTLCSLARRSPGPPVTGRGLPMTCRGRWVAACLGSRRYALVQPLGLLMRLGITLVRLNRPSSRQSRRTSSASRPLGRMLGSAPELLKVLGEFGPAGGRGVSSLARCLGPKPRRSTSLHWSASAPFDHKRPPQSRGARDCHSDGSGPRRRLP
jgi:hypothetical protein